MQRISFAIYFFLLFNTTVVFSQINVFPYKENFDLLVSPSLPTGWKTTTNKNVNGDFTTSTTSVRSAPNALSTTDATKPQSVTTSYFNFKEKFVDSLEFFERRSTTHTSGLLIEASVGTDTTFPILLADTLKFVNGTSYIRRSLSLPAILNDKDSVRFRWRVVGNGSGITGTLRIDDISLTVKKAVDLALTSLTVSTVLPKQGEQITATAAITNRALAGNFSGAIQLFDSLTLISSQNFNQPFALNESLKITLTYTNIKAGRHSLTATLILPGDEDTTNNSISTVINVGFQPRIILINEFMYAPPSGMPEWIECINNSNDTIPISGWKISDAGTTKAPMLPTQRMIVPYSYFIITTDTTAFKNHYSISVPILQASFSALNNTTADAVVFVDPTNSMIDSVFYNPSWGGSGGRSLERIDTSNSSTQQSNWKTSVHPLGATPGTINSVTQKTFDAAINRITISPQFPVTGNSIELSLPVKNIGKQNLSSIHFQLYVDANKDSIMDPDELQFQQFIPSLAANYSITVFVTLSPLPQGMHLLYGKISTPQDEDTSNNIIFLPLTVGLPPKSIVVNEIMYAPFGDMPEWIELYNTSNASVSIFHWKISDNGSTKASIANPLASIAPHSYCIVTTDSSFINFFSIAVPVFVAPFSALNNTTPDAVVVQDERGATMDSVYYKQSWGGLNGNSLQRFDSEGISTDSANWRSAESTPGTANKSIRKNNDVKIHRIQISPSAPIVTQNLTVNATVVNPGKQVMTNVTVQCYLDANNDSVFTSAELQSQNNISSLSVNDSAIITTQFFLPNPGSQKIFVKIISSIDEDSTNNIGVVSFFVGVLPQSIVINEIMYNPLNEIPEWIELYNNSNASISISHWKISDNGSTKASIINPSASIAPHSYCIVATDSSFINFFPIAVPVFVAPFSALNNTTPDAVVVYDERGATMDSVYYKQSWGGLYGNSLQRYDFFAISSDSSNWRNASPSPGIENSSARKNIDVEVKSVTAVKNSSGRQIQTTIFNSGRQTVNALMVKYYHDKNRDSTMQSIELIDSVFIATLNSLDSAMLLYNWNIHIQGMQTIIVTVEAANDMRLTNNVRCIVAKNNFASQTLVINEIMYEPLSGKSEFVELFNRTMDSVDVAEWKLMDQPSSSGSRAIVPLAKYSMIVPPNGFVLVASDSSIFSQYPLVATQRVIINSSLSLNNSGEDLVLTDLTDTQIDSVRYFPLWHLKNISSSGRSLERINPSILSNDARNWSSSVSSAGATPAATNSILTVPSPQSSSLRLFPNPFSPDNDGFEDFLSINYFLPANSTTIRVRIFDVTGRLIRRLAQSELSPPAGSIIWNGMDDDGHRVRIGMYIILFEALDNFGGTAKTMKDVAVVGRKL